MSSNSKASSASDPWRPSLLTAAAVVLSGVLAAMALWMRSLPMPLGAEAVAATACVMLVGLLLWLAGVRIREQAIARPLAQALAADQRARLLVDADGHESYRNPGAAGLFGPVADPCAPLLARARGEERTVQELGRLAHAARHGGAHHAELWLTSSSGDDEWLAVSVYPLAGGGVMWSAEDVTARHAIEETLKRENERLADYLDYLPVGFYSADTEGKIRYLNQSLADWIGRPADELTGMAVRDVLGIVPNPEEDRAEARLRGRNGDVFQAFLTHNVFDAGGETLTRSVVVRDVMPERHWERELRQAERRFRWLFEDAPVGIVLADPDTTISLCNPAFAGMIATDIEDIAGRAIVDFIHVEDRPALADQLSRVMMGTSTGTRIPVRLVSGRQVAATLLIGPAAEDGAVSGLILHFIDVTEQTHLEARFAQSQKMQAMGQLAGGVAHDFNNLLTAMIGFCDLLLQRHGPGDSSFADIMQIKQNSNRAASLVRQLLAFSRRQALQPRLFDVTDALADLSNLLHRLLGETIELVITHGRDLGMVRVDPGQFDQVIVNLAVNARDAMPGGGQLSITTRGIRTDQPLQSGADTMPPADYVQIEVVDTGTGIAPEYIGRIFEPFFSTKEVGAGTGLGLSTVYGIVRQTDGYIFVESQPGAGSRFTIFLPRFDAVRADIRPRPSLLEPSSAADLTGTGTILIVEDEDAVRLFGARALRNKGYRVIEARSGEGALDVLRGDETIDVLITDVVMPGMDGITLARLVRMERPEIRVLLMSGYAEDVALGEVASSPGIHFLPKPFSLKQLAGKVKEAMASPP